MADQDDSNTEELQQLAQAAKNNLELHGNRATMNLNTMILTNIQGSPYFKTQLVELKTFHEVVDEIYYKVDHLEPWERGSRKTQGITGMSGGVRGVGAGGIVSTAYCLLYKCFTLKLTKKQLRILLNHSDSPFIRAVGFMYIRYCLPPANLWDWFEPYFDDDEELDVKAGGGCTMTIGNMLIQWMSKLDWYGTLFPRIPVPIQKEIEKGLHDRRIMLEETQFSQEEVGNEAHDDRRVHNQNYSNEHDTGYSDSAQGASADRYRSSRDSGCSGSYRDRERNRGDRESDRDRYHRSSSSSSSYHHRHHYQQQEHHNERRERDRSRSRERSSRAARESSFERDLRRERDRHRH